MTIEQATYTLRLYIGGSPGVAYGIDPSLFRGSYVDAMKEASNLREEHARRLGVPESEIGVVITKWTEPTT